MSVPAAYLAVVLVWSTTPLAIVWSSESVNPTMAVLLRMLIAVICGWCMMKFLGINFPKNRQAVKLYLFSSIGVFGGMLCSYLAAQTISSGMISLTFGLSPIISGLLAQKILKEAKFGNTRKFAMVISLTGLVVTFFDSFAITSESWMGCLLIFSAVLFFSISGVLVKSVKIDINPLATTVGALTFSIPMFFMAWWLLDGTFNVADWNFKSLLSIAYLGIFGSLIAFVAYYYILQKLSASTVALITMITPVFALFLGAYLNNEIITVNLIYGAFCVMLGLGLYQWGDKMVFKLIAAVNSSRTVL